MRPLKINKLQENISITIPIIKKNLLNPISNPKIV